jgi:hypothetical protein
MLFTMKSIEELRESIKVYTRIQNGIGTLEDHELVASWVKEEMVFFKQNCLEYKAWLVDNGEQCLECWANGPFEPSRSLYTTEALCFFAACYCRSDIINGGFVQCMRNQTGDLAPEAIIGLTLIGTTNAAAVLQRVVDCFPKPYPRSPRLRSSNLTSILDLEDKTTEFVKACEDEYFDKKANEFFASHNISFSNGEDVGTE